jgi:hypothetical protein
VLNPTVDDAEAILRFRDRSGRMCFDLQRKILMFGNMPVERCRLSPQAAPGTLKRVSCTTVSRERTRG